MATPVPTSYLVAYARTPEYFSAIQGGTAPGRFTQEFLENLGFTGKADRRLIPVLKELRFLDESNVPTQVYRDYLDHGRAKEVLAKQILQSYEAIFELNRNAHRATVGELRGRFKSLANASDDVAENMANTFLNLCKIADIETARQERPAPRGPQPPADGGEPADGEGKTPRLQPSPPTSPSGQTPLSLGYHIELHLPNTTDPEVFRAIFKALKEHLIH